MKKLVTITILFILLFTFSINAFANSGPVFWQGYPSSVIMSVDDNSPIMIKGEELIFDFTNYEGAHYTISGMVNATYNMVNSADENQTVLMAFPFVGRLGGFTREDIKITVDGNMLPYDLYIGDIVGNLRNSTEQEKKKVFDFETVVNNITDDTYKAANFSDDEMGKLYTIHVKPTTDLGINFAVNFNFNHEKTKVITNGFNRLERNNRETMIAAWCHEPRTLEIFVLGENIEFNINSYTDGELKDRTDLLTYEISTQEMEIKSYLMRYIKENTRDIDYRIISDNQIYNLYAKSLDESFSNNLGYCSDDDLRALNYPDRIFTIVYETEFPANSEKKVSVRYKITGTMDKTETAKPLYSFDYILNPAKNWSSFNNLNIEIITPEEAPYIVRSSIEFEKKENNVYTAELVDLPENDLSFTLYEDEKITFIDKINGSLHKRFGYLTPIVVGVLAFLIAIGITIIYIGRKKHNKGNKGVGRL